MDRFATSEVDMSNVSQLVKDATGAESVSVIWQDGAGSAEVLAANTDPYGRRIMTRYDALVLDGKLCDLSLTGSNASDVAMEDVEDMEIYRSEYAMGGQW